MQVIGWCICERLLAPTPNNTRGLFKEHKHEVLRTQLGDRPSYREKKDGGSDNHAE